MTKKSFQKYFSPTLFLNVPLVINTLTALITLPIVLANLPVADYGKWQFVLALQAWSIAITGANITSASKKGVAKGLNGTLLYSFLARIKPLTLVGLIFAGTAFYLRTLGHPIFAGLLLIQGFYLVFGYLFQLSINEFMVAKKKFKEQCFWRILISLFSTISSVFIVFYTKNVIYFAFFQLGTVTVLSWAGWVQIIKKWNVLESYRRGEIDRECVPFGLKLILSDFLLGASGRLSHFIIGPFFGFTNLAVFSIAWKLRDKGVSVIKSARPLLYADFSGIKRKKLVKIVHRHLIKIGMLGSFLALGSFGFSWFYIKFFLPEPFQLSIIYFAILASAFPAVTLAIVLHTILESHFRHKELGAIRITSALLEIMLILFFGYTWRATGVCAALAISSWITFGLYFFLTVKKEAALKFIQDYPYLEKLVKKY